MAESLAPAVVVRAARFPRARLLALADAPLAAAARRQAREATLTDAEFAALYDQQISVQRQILARATTADDRFVRALAITNADFTRLALRFSGTGRRDKRARHLETTLYRYLARAVSRTEPCDLWSGVALATWGPVTHVELIPSRYAIAPDLRPFQAIVRSLAERDGYRYRGRFRVNPTLTMAPGHWELGVRTSRGPLKTRRLPRRPGLDEVLGRLTRATPGSLEQLRRQLVAGGVAAENMDDVLRFLRDQGVLVGGLSFPSKFTSAWDALLRVRSQLDDGDARVWFAAFRDLRRACRRLERDLEHLPPTDLQAAEEATRQRILGLARALGVAGPDLPRSLLRCDHRLPWRIVLGPAIRRSLEQAIEEYAAFEATAGLDQAVRAVHLQALLGTGPTVSAAPSAPAPVDSPADTPLSTQEKAWRAAGADVLLGERMRQWAARLQAPGLERTWDIGQQVRHDVRQDVRQGVRPAAGASPLAALILRPAGQAFAIEGSTPEIGAAYARYMPLWALRSDPSHVLHDWYRANLQRVAGESGICLAELIHPCEPAPNALARPDFALPILDLWGPDSDIPLAAYRMTTPAGRAAPLLVADDAPSPVAAAFFPALNVGGQSEAVERLLATSFRAIPRWISDQLPFECELRGRPSPRLRLPGGNVLRTRRTTLVGPVLRQLLDGPRPQRFIRWQCLAEEHGWPPVVLLGRDLGRPMLVVRDSPLALEAALEGVGQGVACLTIEEPEDTGWLTDGKGEKYATELVVPFLRPVHAWSRELNDLAAVQHPAAPERSGRPSRGQCAV
jgi:hypothetical protein